MVPPAAQRWQFYDKFPRFARGLWRKFGEKPTRPPSIGLAPWPALVRRDSAAGPVVPAQKRGRDHAEAIFRGFMARDRNASQRGSGAVANTLWATRACLFGSRPVTCWCAEPVRSRRFAAGRRRAVPSASTSAGTRDRGHRRREDPDVREEGADHLLDFGAVAAVGKMRCSFHDAEQGAGNRRGDLADISAVG